MTDVIPDLPQLDPGRLIQRLWESWLALLDRYDGRGLAETDPVERVRVHIELQSRALLLCAIPAPNGDSLKAKALVAAWCRDHAADTWAGGMIEHALALDTLELQPANDLAI